MKNKKLFLGSGLMILTAVAVLPMLVGAAPSFPPPTGLPSATFNSIQAGYGSTVPSTAADVKGTMFGLSGNSTGVGGAGVYAQGVTLGVAGYATGTPSTGGSFQATTAGVVGTSIAGTGVKGSTATGYGVEGDASNAAGRGARFVNSVAGTSVILANSAEAINATGNIYSTGSIGNPGLTIASNGDISDTSGAVIINDPQGLTLNQGTVTIGAGGGNYGGMIINAPGWGGLTIDNAGSGGQTINATTGGLTINASAGGGFQLNTTGGIVNNLAGQSVNISDSLAVSGWLYPDGGIFASSASAYLGYIQSYGNLIANGFLGVGTTSPSAGIHVRSSGFPGSFMYLDTTGFSQDSGIRFMEAGNVRSHIYNQSSNDSLMILASGAGPGGIELTQGGNVGIGVAAPTYKLDVNGTARVSGWFYPNSGVSTSGTIYAGTVGASGYVGAGTTSPSYQLHVRNASCGGGCMIAKFSGSSYVDIFGDGWVNMGGTLQVQGGNIYVTTGKGYQPGGSTWGVWSDASLKDIRGDYDRGLNEVVALNPIEFTYKKDNPMDYDSIPVHIGLIAQDVENVIPEAVTQADTGYLELDFHSINIAMINAIKELKAENDELKAVVCELKPDAVVCSK